MTAPASMRSHPSPLFREAMNLARPDYPALSAGTGIPGATLNAYHAGTRPAPLSARLALAQFLRVQAAALEVMAATLERDAHPAPAEASPLGDR
jgi:hypothetical protein